MKIFKHISYDRCDKYRNPARFHVQFQFDLHSFAQNILCFEKSLFVSATYKCNYYYSMNSKSSKCEIRESTASLSLAERWTITEIRRPSNSVLTYSLLTDVLPL